MATKEIKIDSLVTENLQMRLQLDEKTIVNYAQHMDDGKEFPPIVVFCEAARPESSPYLADGFHRIEARRRLGHDTILAEVHEGTFDDALSYALNANSQHGLNMTDGDVANVCRIAWENRRVLFHDIDETNCHFVTRFAEKCGVSRKTAYKHLNKLNCNPVTKLPSVPDALKVTREHLEERDANVRALLKEQKDRFGIAIPDRLLAAFRSREPQQLTRDLNDIYKVLEKRRMEGDMVFAPFVAYSMTHLDNMINTIRHGLVYCVCRMCRGEGCGSCNNLGFQTRPQYDRNPSEFKAEKQ